MINDRVIRGEANAPTLPGRYRELGDIFAPIPFSRSIYNVPSIKPFPIIRKFVTIFLLSFSERIAFLLRV